MSTYAVVQIQWENVGVVAMTWGIDPTIRYHVSTQAPATTTLLENVEEVISCKDSINPLLVSLTQQYMCTNTVNGLYDLWAVQVAGSVMLYLILILTEFVRPYIGAKAKPADGQPAYVGQPISHGKVEGNLNYDV
jgi:hypothetical protein